ncbi:MAG: type II toxin-antitoxin system VapC family toxin [Bacteroidales bacterium]|nr:type II toxin-antitoxin system VapC family toxin [Bacteroidales bacterium]
MNLFFDTSALVKIFSNESGSGEAKELVDSSENQIWVSELAKVELISALFKKYRSREISNDQLENSIKFLENQIDEFSIVSLASDNVDEAATLLKKFGKKQGLRTLDALHVASFILVAEQTWKFISSDERQIIVVKELGYYYNKI